MKLKDSINLEIDKETANYVLDILVEHQKGYSLDFPPERINKIRKIIDFLKEKLYK
jgi:hypothetical protein